MILMGDEYGHSKVSCPPKRLPAPCWEASCRRCLCGCRAGTTIPTATTRRSTGSTGGKRQPMRLDLPASSGCWSTCGMLPALPSFMAQRSAANASCHTTHASSRGCVQQQGGMHGPLLSWLLACRRQRPELRQRDFVGPAAIQWHGVQAGSTDWSEASRLVAFTLSGPSGGLYIAFNSSHLPTTVQLPDWYGRQWQPLVDTGKVIYSRRLK